WHTPNNDFWENAFPDRSRQPAQDGAGHLKPVFTLRDKNNPESYDVELFRPVINSNIATNILRSFNVGRGIVRILARFGWEYENDIALKQWLHLIPSANGLNVDESQCPIEKIELWKMINDYDRYADRLITVETDEAVEESRSHLTPFLETLSLRDEYTKRITHRPFFFGSQVCQTKKSVFSREPGSTRANDRMEGRREFSKASHRNWGLRSVIYDK